MSRAKRRDEWDRASQLMSLVYNRTLFSKTDSPIQPIDLFPSGLITQTDRDVLKESKRVHKARTTIKADITCLKVMLKNGGK